jgi:hypothetical protein
VADVKNTDFGPEVQVMGIWISGFTLNPKP